jgi:hypothetical protein
VDLNRNGSIPGIVYGQLHGDLNAAAIEKAENYLPAVKHSKNELGLLFHIDQKEV